MKSSKKLLSVLLSLVLCGSMAAPAFAATFEELSTAINDTEYTAGDKIKGTDTYGYAKNEEGGYGIIAWDQEGVRHVQLNEDVKRTDPVYPDPDPEASPICDMPDGIYVGRDTTLDMQGHTIDGNNGGTVFNVVGEDAKLTINAGEAGTITGGESIEGGAVRVINGASFEMNGGKITGNRADQGGGIYAGAGTEVTLNGTEVSGNGADDVYLDYDEEMSTGARLNADDDAIWADTADPEKTWQGSVDSREEAGPLSLKWAGSDKGTGGGTTEPGKEPTGVEITDSDVPLAVGPVSCMEFINKMWRLDGEPAPVDGRGVDGEPALAWAMSANIVSAESFDPEELLTVALAREFLSNFAAYADMVMPELTTLTGSDDDLVMNSDEVLAEFFGVRQSV